MTEDARVFLSVDAAIALLPDGEDVHVFSNPSAGVLVGSDWDREDLEAEIRSAKVREIGGAACRGMHHGLVLDGHWFIATRKDVDWEAVGKKEAVHD